MECFVFSGHSGIEEIDEVLNGLPNHLIKLIQSFCVMTKTKSQKSRQKNARKNATAVARGLAPPLPRRTASVPKRRKGPKKSPKSNLGTEGKIARIGRYIGTGAKAFFKAVTGFGDYKIGTNSLMNKNEVPIVSNSGNGDNIIVKHREYITDVTCHELFTNTSFSLNPGISDTFPWLSAIATNFEEYQIRGMIFEFKTMAADFNSSTTTMGLGTVVMATQYNVLLPDFPDKRTMENYEFACSSKPSLTFVHPIECAKNQTPDTHLYVRTGEDLGSGGDLRLYDLGTFQIAMQGQPPEFENSVIGELWCSYEIELFKPKLSESLGIGALADLFFTSTAGRTAGLFGVNVITQPWVGSTCGCFLKDNSIMFPTNCHGRYYITINAHSATASTTTCPNMTAGNNVTKVNSVSNALNWWVADVAAGGGNVPPVGSIASFMMGFYVDVTPDVTGGNPTLILTWSSGNTNWGTEVNIIQVPPGFNGQPPTYMASAAATLKERQIGREHTNRNVDPTPVKVENARRSLVDLSQVELDALRRILKGNEK
jgi:hypothetical protein